jgi:hypothetical protein
MARKKKEENLIQIPPDAPPPPLFLGQRERNLVKQINDELIERVIGQAIVYYPISRDHTNYHPIYGEAIQKTFLSPVKINALVTWEGSNTTTEAFGIDRRNSLIIKFHKRRLIEDQDIYVREGDFVLYDAAFYEIVSLNESKVLFGQDTAFEVDAKCIRARDSVFNAK